MILLIIREIILTCVDFLHFFLLTILIDMDLESQPVNIYILWKVKKFGWYKSIVISWNRLLLCKIKVI